MLSGFIISPNWLEIPFLYSILCSDSPYSFKKSHSQIYKHDVQMDKEVICQINIFEFLF